MIGVYKIENLVTGDCYIGSSINITWRIYRHRSLLKRNLHWNSRLQMAWNSYGKAQFLFVFLEECSKEMCLEREQFYIDTMQSFYNISRFAGTNKGNRKTLAFKAETSKRFKGKPQSEEHKRKKAESIKQKIVRIGPEGHEQVFDSITDVCIQYGYFGSNISACINNKAKTAYGFSWRKY